jgi:hypothetical protein
MLMGIKTHSGILGVEHGLLHLLGSSDTSSVDDTLAERTGGGLDTGSVVLGVGELRVARSHGVVLTEVLDLLHGEIIAGDVEPLSRKMKRNQVRGWNTHHPRSSVVDA